MVSRHLISPKLRQAFSIQPLLVGGNPFSTTSIYGLIHYLDRTFGVFFAMGGTGAIVNAYKNLMERNNIEIILNQSVNKIIIDQGKAVGLTLENGSKISTDIIVSNADPAYLYKNMVDQDDVAIATKVKIKLAYYSMGLMVIYFGTTRKYPDVVHHTIWLGKTYKELLSNIFDKKILSDDFSLYIHRPTATDESFAPEGCDSFYVLCPVPNLKADIEWSVEGDALKNRIKDAIKEEKRLVAEEGKLILIEKFNSLGIGNSTQNIEVVTHFFKMPSLLELLYQIAIKKIDLTDLSNFQIVGDK
jgi:phytoene desaturase